ncbi:hypothetical protein GBAR_LOCUS14740, partial [Geodia barretti]
RLPVAADRRPGGGGRGYYRRGPPRRPRQQTQQQDSQGEDRSEGNEGEGDGEQVDRRRPRQPRRRGGNSGRRFNRRGPPRKSEVHVLFITHVFLLSDWVTVILNGPYLHSYSAYFAYTNSPHGKILFCLVLMH